MLAVESVITILASLLSDKLNAEVAELADAHV